MADVPERPPVVRPEPVGEVITGVAQAPVDLATEEAAADGGETGAGAAAAAAADDARRSAVADEWLGSNERLVARLRAKPAETAKVPLQAHAKPPAKQQPLGSFVQGLLRSISRGGRWALALKLCCAAKRSSRAQQAVTQLRRGSTQET